MKAHVGVDIFEADSVVLFVGKEANDSAPAERNCSLTQCHRHAADLLALLAEKNILDSSYLYFHGGLLALLKLQSAVLNRQSPVSVVGGVFKTQEMRDVSAEGFTPIRWPGSVLSEPSDGAT